MPGKDSSNLRPQVATEGLRFDRRQYNWNIKYSGGLGKRHSVVDDSLAIEIACSKQHLALMVDQRHDAIVRRQESFFTQFWTTVVLNHDYSLLLEVNGLCMAFPPSSLPKGGYAAAKGVVVLKKFRFLRCKLEITLYFRK